MKQIICSMSDIGSKLVGIADNDNGFVINPGYKFIMFKNSNYNTPYYDANNYWIIYDNTYGMSAIYKANSSSPDNIDEIGSIKVYWMNEEIIIDGIS